MKGCIANIGKFAAIFLCSLVFLCVPDVNAQVPQNPNEVIKSFDATIKVNTDNSIDVEEIIIYNTGLSEHHGIYRDIIPYSSTGRKMKISVRGVTDELGNPHMYDVQNVSGNVRIKIGDPSQTFSGEKTYKIKYHATRAVAQFENIDEIYWNVTGNSWVMPIESAHARVLLPTATPEDFTDKISCYYGLQGSNTQCISSFGVSGSYDFYAPSILNVHEGMTVAVGFPKGVVSPYGRTDAFIDFIYRYSSFLLGALLPILTLIFMLRIWYVKWRDPKGTGVIVPQYDVPENLTPLEVAGIMEERVLPKHFGAEIIYLATKGYLKIRQEEKEVFGFKVASDYELTQLIKDDSAITNEFDKKLLHYLFSLFSSPIKISRLKNKFYSHIPPIIKLVIGTLKNDGYYKNLGKMSGSVIVVVWFVPFISFFFFIMPIFGEFFENPFPLVLGGFLSFIIIVFIYYFSPAKTEKGVATKEYILGLKDYLQIAEKDRLKFHNAPEKKPEIFEKLLPFALVLGVEKSWAKEFEDIYTTPPSWYEGVSGSHFSTISLSDNFTNFSQVTSSVLSSAPSSSGGGGMGSGGGGSSGGGGGGGGGGSW